MTVKKLNRREFLKMLGLVSMIHPAKSFFDLLPEDEHITEPTPIKIVRVGIRKDEVRLEPSLDSPIIHWRQRDELVRVYEEFVSQTGPPHNPRWYRVLGGYMHTAHLAPVSTQLNPIVSKIREGGQVFQVTVPYTNTFRFSNTFGWEPLYRLYFESNHWVTGMDEGPDGKTWYIITDDLLKVEYFVNPAHMRLVSDEEFTPIRPDVMDKLIRVSLRDQTVTCLEEGVVVFHTSVSTGIPNLQPTSNGIPTDTPRGEFRVSMKTPVKHMGNGMMTSNIHAYELPGVPWCTFFTETGVAFHGTYWHDNYGGRMSRGCVNMRTEEARWIYRWTTPVYNNEPGIWHQNGWGTRIIVS